MITITTSNGAIEGNIIPFTSLNSRTTNGALVLNIPSSGPIRDERSYDVSAHTINGRIRLTFPDSFSGRFDAAARVGSVSVSGSDLHFDNAIDPSRFPPVGGRRTGWKGPQKVTAGSVNEAVEIAFV